MLDEVGANFAVVETLPQAAEREVEVWENRLVPVLDDEFIEKGKGVRERTTIGFVARFIAGFGGDGERGCDAFEINCGRVAGRVGLMVVDESAGLFLLVTEQPVRDFKDELGERCVVRNVPPLAEGLQQPRDLAEVAFVTEAMTVVTKSALES